MISCPVDFFTDNLVFGNDRSCWAIYELKGFDYDMLSDESKIAIMDRLTLFLANVPSEAKFMVLPVVQDLDSHFNALIKGLNKSDPLFDYTSSFSAATKQYLQEQVKVNGRSNDYKTYVSIKLHKEGVTDLASQAREALEFLVKGVINDFNAFMAIDIRDIRKSKIDSYSKLATGIYTDLSKRMALLPVDANTTQWLLRRVMHRGLQKDVRLFTKSQNESWQPSTAEINLAGNIYIRPKKREMVNLFSGSIHKKGRTLQVDHESDTSFQTFLTITNIPEDLSFPDCEWIYLLQQMKKSAEIYIHIRNIEHREALKKIELQRRAANSQLENIEKASAEIPEELFESKEAIDALEAELKASKLPLTETSVVICLSDCDPQQLEEKAAAVRREYEDMNFIVERPLTDQFSLFLGCLPCVGFTVSDFTMRLTPMALASGLIGATHELGSHTGGYIGTTGIERKQVYLDLRQACLSNMSASTTFYGNLGVGKSFNANLLLYLHILTGAFGLIIDPKGERSHWVEQLPGLAGLITLVTLSPDPQYKGMLDPFNIFRGNVDEAAELAINLLSELFKINPKDYKYTALLEALNKIRSHPLPSMEALAEILGCFPDDDTLKNEASMLSRQIKLLSKSGMSQLLIGNGSEKAISLDNRLNILQIQNLRLPDPNAKKEDYTQEENVSLVLMMVITAFCRKFMHAHPNQFKVLLFDESWMLGKTTEGEKLMSYVARMARSLYTSMILNGHSVTDLPNEGIRNSITYKFCFKTGNSAEAERMLDFLRLEKTPTNIELIMGLKNGQCFFQDLNGRVGILQFDAVFEDLIQVFSTTPVDIATLKTDETPEIPAPAAEDQPEENSDTEQQENADAAPPAADPALQDITGSQWTQPVLKVSKTPSVKSSAESDIFEYEVV